MIIDVEFGPRGKLYALSQGDFGGGDPGSPAAPNTGRLLRVNNNGTFTILADDWTGRLRSILSTTPRSSSR